MFKSLCQFLSYIAAIGLLVACAADKDARSGPMPETQASVYEKCVADRQMVAMAIEAIEEQCRKEASKAPPPDQPLR